MAKKTKAQKQKDLSELLEKEIPKLTKEDINIIQKHLVDDIESEPELESKPSSKKLATTKRKSGRRDFEEMRKAMKEVIKTKEAILAGDSEQKIIFDTDEETLSDVLCDVVENPENLSLELKKKDLYFDLKEKCKGLRLNKQLKELVDDILPNEPKKKEKKK